jgi:hypothetical protein
MLLKCRYLSQFSVSELTKNASTISKAVDGCPFMTHAKRSLTTSTGFTESASNQKAAQTFAPIEQVDEIKQFKSPVCTDSINCPFFVSNAEMNKLVTKKNFDDLNDTRQESMIERKKFEGKKKLF